MKIIRRQPKNITDNKNMIKKNSYPPHFLLNDFEYFLTDKELYEEQNILSDISLEKYNFLIDTVSVLTFDLHKDQNSSHTEDMVFYMKDINTFVANYFFETKEIKISMLIYYKDIGHHLDECLYHFEKSFEKYCLADSFTITLQNKHATNIIGFDISKHDGRPLMKCLGYFENKNFMEKYQKSMIDVINTILWSKEQKDRSRIFFFKKNLKRCL